MLGKILSCDTKTDLKSSHFVGAKLKNLIAICICDQCDCPSLHIKRYTKYVNHYSVLLILIHY